jgi:hypothetical protein
MRSGWLVGLLMLWPAVAGAQAVEGSLALGQKVLPLPPGPWRVLHQAAEPGRSVGGDFATTTYRAVLVQEREGRAAAVIIAHAAAEVGGVWNPHGICISTNHIRRQVDMAVRGALDCRGLVVVGSGRGPVTPAYLNALYDEGERRPGWIPPRWISVQVVQSEQMHWLSVEYRFAPAVFAPAAAMAASWGDGVRTPAQQDMVNRLFDWSALARAQLRRGLHGRPPSAALPSPF